MNKLNEELMAIKNQKKVYHRQCELARKENNMQELYNLSKKILILDQEEVKILNELSRGGL